MKNPFGKPSEADKRSAAFQAQRAVARRKLAELDAGKASALADSVSFARWTADRNAASLEVDRLSGLIETNESAAEAARKAEADAAARRETAAAWKEFEELRNFLQDEGPRIFGEVLNLSKRCTQQSLAAKALNERLPDGEAPIPAADIVARDFGTAPRKDLKSREVELWVAATTGALIGDQDAVASEDGIHGQVHVFGGSMRWKCVKRRFRETEFHPSSAADWPGDFYSLIRLPRLDGPGFLFDGARMIPEAVAALDVAAAVAPRKKQPRPTQIELVPVDPVWPADA